MNLICIAGFTEVTLSYYTSTQQTIANLLRLPIVTEIRDMQRIYIKTAVRALVAEFQSSLQSSIDSIQTIKLILFLIFFLMVVVNYVVFWWPIADNLTEDIWRT